MDVNIHCSDWELGAVIGLILQDEVGPERNKAHMGGCFHVWHLFLVIFVLEISLPSKMKACNHWCTEKDPRLGMGEPGLPEKPGSSSVSQPCPNPSILGK